MSRTFRRLLRAYYKLNEIVRTPPNERGPWDRLTLRFREGLLTTAISKRYTASIPISATIARGVEFPHDFDGLHISFKAVLGTGTVVFQHVTIGINDSGEAPIIGRNVTIGAGAVLIGRTVIGDGARIGANVTLSDVEIPPGAIIVNANAYDVANRRPVYPDYKKREPALLAS